MGDQSSSMEDLPLHLILEILACARLRAMDLVCLELASKTFRANPGLFPHKFRSFVDFAAFKLCGIHPIYLTLGHDSKDELLNRCDGNWKRVLHFLQAVHQSSEMVHTSSGHMQIQTGRYHTLLNHDMGLYSSGTNTSGVLGHGPETKQCVTFTPIRFPFPSRVVQVSASHNHAAFVTEAGEVYTCGDNTSSCCGHRDTRHAIFGPKLVEELKGIPCKQVATGLSFTLFLSRHGYVYTCGINTHGQLGHGDALDRHVPEMIEALQSVNPIVHIASGPSFALAVAEDGTVFSFGSDTNFCLGHGEQHNELLPRAIQSLKRKGVHVVRVSAGDEHVVALDSNGQVYTWGKGYCGALGHGDEIDRTTPEILTSLQSHLAVQVCAGKRKTFVVMDDGSIYGFGWMSFGSLGFPDRRESDKIMKPQVLDSLTPHRISQVSTGLYHTMVVTSQGLVFGFGDNERSQLGHEVVRGCLVPTEISIR